MKPQALASALTKISGGADAIPQKDLRCQQRGQLAVHRPGRARGQPRAHPHRHPPVPRAAPRAAGPDPGRARPADGLGAGVDGRLTDAAVASARQQPGRAVPRAQRGDHPGDRGRLLPTGVGCRLLPIRRGSRLRADPGRDHRPDQRRPRGARRHRHPRRLRLHLAGRAGRPGGRRPASAPTCTRSTRCWRRRASRPACCARWSASPATTGPSDSSTSTSAARSTRSPRRARTSATTSPRSRTRPARRRAPDGAGPAAVARAVECSRTVNTPATTWCAGRPGRTRHESFARSRPRPEQHGRGALDGRGAGAGGDRRRRSDERRADLDRPSGAQRRTPAARRSTPCPPRPRPGRSTTEAPQSRCDLPGRSSIRCSATSASRSVSGSTMIRLTTCPATSDSIAHTRCGRSMRFIVEQ